MPSDCHMTSPRQYIGPSGPALRSGNSARKATSVEFASAAMLPGERRSEKPVFAVRLSPIRGQKPVLIRGNRRKSKTTSGAAWASSLKVVASGSQKAPEDDPL